MSGLNPSLQKIATLKEEPTLRFGELTKKMLKQASQISQTDKMNLFLECYRQFGSQEQKIQTCMNRWEEVFQFVSSNDIA